MEELKIKLVHWAVAVPAAWMMAALPSCEAVPAARQEAVQVHIADWEERPVSDESPPQGRMAEWPMPGEVPPMPFEPTEEDFESGLAHF